MQHPPSHHTFLFSEEIFDFSGGQMTQAKIKELKGAYNKEFSLIYQLCEIILTNSQKPSLIKATLETLLRFLNWIPIGYIFQTKMIENLIFKVRMTQRLKGQRAERSF